MQQQQPSPAPTHSAHEEQLASLLAAAATGDSSAFESFYNATAHRLLEAVRGSTDNDCESTMVDCYLQAWRHASGFDPSRSTAFEWLLALCHSLAGDRSAT